MKINAMKKLILDHKWFILYWSIVSAIVILLLLSGLALSIPFSIPVIVAIAIAFWFNYFHKKDTTSESISYKQQDFNNEDSSLKIVDITIIDTEEFPKIDVKLRNVGKKVAFLKRAEFHVYMIWTLKPPIMPRAEPVSYNYDVSLEPRETPYVVTKNISQSIDPNDVDRFTFTLGHHPSYDIEDHIYNMKLRFFYDENDKIIESNNVLFLMPPSSTIMGAYSPGGEFAKSCLKYNKNIALEVKKIDGFKSKRLLRFIDQILRL